MITRDETRKRLWGWSEEIQTPVRALLFGELVKLATPVVEHYQSDLFHDARWVTEHVTGACVFFYGLDAWGTAIGTDFELVHRMRSLAVYRVELVNDGGQWSSVISKVQD